MKISSYIFLSFFIVLLLFSVTTYVNFRLSQTVNEDVEYATNSMNIIRQTGRFQRNLQEMVSGLRGYLLTGERYFVDSYDSASAENEEILKELSIIITDEEQKNVLQEIVVLNTKWSDGYAEPLRQAKMQATVNEKNLQTFNKVYRERYLTGEERRIQETLRERFKIFADKVYQTRTDQRYALRESAERAKNITLLLVILSAVISFIVIMIVVRLISRRISTMVRLADNIASGNYQVKVNTTARDELTPLEVSLDHMANELENYIGLLRTKNEELDQYAHIVSHDMKGPLRGIDNVVNWIEEDHKEEISPKVAEYLQLIKNRIVRAEYLIEGILSYARTDKEKVEKGVVNVKELIEEISDELTPRPGLSVQITSALPILITERLPLYQVFTNLISNAIKYHDKAKGTIKVYAKEHTDHYEFFVEDDGKGIEDQYFKKIFVIFQTLQDRDSFESTGVGLAIVKKLLDSRDEKIQVASTPGRGSTFSFTWKK